MSAKLIVQKSEEGINHKYLFITFENGSSKTVYSEWFDGISEQKKKNYESSRLIIKMVSGRESKYLDLDSCSKENFNSSENSNYTPTWLGYSSQKSNNERDEDQNCAKNFSGETILNHNQDANVSISPLEYSLEKVKKNNARIMENIHMLNRTLNYTKKKEIFDVIWPSSKCMKTYPCNVCGKHFVYITGLKRHYAMRHVVSESQQQWQVVWTCTECFQVWPRKDLALSHSNQCGKEENTDCICEIKTSSLLQCEFCEKVFTSIPRLLKHSKTHTVTYNYECYACKMSFHSYKSAEQHWLFCPWLNMCYRFALPKLLLCNVCDRKFRNYDQLYNHRYKVGHFMTKLKIECNNKYYFVYQCEICGDELQTISLMTMHRNQIHPHESGLHTNIQP